MLFSFRIARPWISGALAASLLLLTSPSKARAAEPEERFAAIVLDAETGQTLYARYPDARRYPASLTKVMTLFLAFDAIEAGKLKLSDPVVISPRAAARPPSRLGLPVGDRLTVRQAMDVMVVKSANDVATALGETLGGTEAAFARAMTAKAKALGMTHTRFANASGLPDPRHYSTARDLAVLGRAFLREHPDDYTIFDQERTVFRGRTIRGHNALLSRPGIDGFKTGFVNASGFNLLTSGMRDGHRVIAVVLGGRTARTRDAFMARLMRASFASLTIRDAGTDLTVAQLLEAEQITHASRSPSPAAPPLLARAAPLESFARPTLDDAAANMRVAAQAPAKLHWWIQVGAFRSRDNGRARLASLSDRHPHRFGRRPKTLAPLGGLFAARFAAKSQSSAQSACALLTAEGEDCLVLQE